MIGSALVPALEADGHGVVRLVRRLPSTPQEARWDPAAGTVDQAALAGTDAVVHLAGAGVGDHRWTDSYKAEIRSSRVLGTGTIARSIAALDPPPRVLVSASAIGFYGDTGAREVDESAPQGAGFLAEVVRDWEAAADPAREAGIRVVHPRTGLVVSADGGAWARLFPLFRLGVGGRLGNGQQYWSFISLRDQVRALQFLISTAELAGPVNLTAQHPVTNAEVTAAMGRALHRPTPLAVPAFALRLALGEFSSEVLGSARIFPGKLTEAGFTWRDGTIEQAIEAAR